MVVAWRAGSKHLVLPRDNEKDFRELSKVVRNKLTVHLVDTMDEVLALALVGGDGKIRKAKGSAKGTLSAEKKKSSARPKKA